jgi:hypothetical protein
MKKILSATALLIGLSACSSPNDIIFGPEPLKQMQEQSENFSKLSKEDRELLVSYIGLNELANKFLPGDQAKVVTGKTVGEVLDEAKQWKQEIEAKRAEEQKLKAEEEARQKALAEKIRTENQALQERINNSMTFAITNTKTLSKNYDLGRFSDMLTLIYSVENKSEKTIVQIKGNAKFSDLSGEEFASLPINFDSKVGPGKTLTTDLDKGWTINQFMNNDINKVAMRSFDQMRIFFEPEVVVFSDGESIKLSTMTQ